MFSNVHEKKLKSTLVLQIIPFLHSTIGSTCFFEADIKFNVEWHKIEISFITLQKVSIVFYIIYANS